MPEYWEESWRLEETCNHSNFSGRPSANTGMKNSQMSKIMIIIIIVINIPTDNITELNDLIYPGAKLINNKINTSLSNPNRNTKPGWEMKLEVWIKKLREQGKVVRKEKYTKARWNEMTGKRQ